MEQSYAPGLNDNGSAGVAIGTMEPGPVDQRDIDRKYTSRTSPQIRGSYGPASQSELYTRWQRYHELYEEMNGDPTFAFAKMLSVAPLVTVGWTYEENGNAPIGARDAMEAAFEPHRRVIMKATMEGYIQYGWQPFEVVWTPQADKDMLIEPTKVKMLLQDQTRILIDRRTGEYLGLRQWQGADQQPVDLSVYDSLCIALDVVGTDWYGRPLYENGRSTFEQSKVVTASSDRYDKKIAGSHWVVYYPVGKSPYNGIETDNYAIAQTILNSMEACGKIAVPRKVQAFIDDLNNSVKDDIWKVDLLSDEGRGGEQFISRMRYCDSLKVRSMGIPERAVLEGQFGTKAEAESQADFAIVNVEMRHQIIVDYVNRGMSELFMDVNYGKEYKNSVIVKPVPLTDAKKKMWTDIYKAFLVDPNIRLMEHDNIDMQAMRSSLSLPERQYDPQTMAAMDIPGQIDPQYYDPSFLGGVAPDTFPMQTSA
jgi:hypothetical protein